MTPEEIIKNKEWYPEWENIKLSNPSEYQLLCQNAILRKLEQVLPFYLKWQRRVGGFYRYMDSLPPITESLNALNFEEYENGLAGKKSLTSQFFSKCISFSYFY